MQKTGLRRQVAWLIFIRAVISTMLLGSATFAEIRAPGLFQASNPFFYLIGLTYGLTILYASSLRFVERHRWLVDVQLAVDALVVTAFIYFTGGIGSLVTSLYVLPIAAASSLQFRRGGLLVAALSAVLFVGLVSWQYVFGELPIAARSAFYTAGLNVFGFFAVALLSGSLANRLQSAGAQLEQASEEIADLQALNQIVIDSLPSGLATTDFTHRILTFNRASESITGVRADAAIGRPIKDVLHLTPAIMESITGDLDLPGVRRHEFRYQMPDGRDEREIGMTATHLDTPGHGPGLLLTFQDVTGIKKLERDAAIQQRLAAVGEMAAGIAHEIRNPLASM